MPINIAIDGPAGAGKSSIAKKVSSELGIIYVDTGALYRSVAYYVLENNINEKSKLIKSLKNIKISIEFKNGSQHVILNDKDVSEKIRTPQVSIVSSKVSAIPEVREFLFDLQRKIAAGNSCIMDGRDIGTIVLPNADVKIFLTASVEKRAQRRWLETSEEDRKDTSLEEIEADIKWRDYNDTHRKTAPLAKAKDAVELDTSDLNFEESCEAVKKIIQQKTGEKNEV